MNHYTAMSEYLWKLAKELGCVASLDGYAECDHCQLRGIAGDIDRLGTRLEAVEAELEVARDLLRDAPSLVVGYQWREAVCDYLETCPKHP